MKDYRIVTISNRVPTEWYYLRSEFYRSLGEHANDVLTVQPSIWGGLTTKPNTLCEMIEQGQIKEKYIIFPDNWDLVFATDPEEIMDIYQVIGKDIVISAEKNCFPADLKDTFDEIAKANDDDSPYRYLNSGFIVGRTDSIYHCLRAMGAPNLPYDSWDNERNCANHPNDQEEWQKIYCMVHQHNASIHLDTGQLLSQTLHGAEPTDFDFSRKRIRNKVTGNYSCTYHFNGGSKSQLELREPILKHLNLL
jgi:hypothetical protein